MIIKTPFLIKKLCINKKEFENRSRLRRGFHVYISWLFFEFNKLSLEEQHKFIFQKDKVRLGRYWIGENDNVSIDSTSSVLSEKVPRVVVHRSACLHWRYNTSPELKKAWSNRAQKLNRRKLPGKFVAIPWNSDRKKEIIIVWKKMY